MQAFVFSARRKILTFAPPFRMVSTIFEQHIQQLSRACRKPVWLTMLATIT